MDARAFEDANAACSLLPGPSSTQLAIFCAYRVGGPAGAVIGGLGFVVPAVVMVLALSVLFLSSAPPEWVRGAGAGAGAAVAAVAVRAGGELVRPSYEHAMAGHGHRLRWLAYLLAGVAAAIAIGPYLVLVLVACGLLEVLRRTRPGGDPAASWSPAALLTGGGVARWDRRPRLDGVQGRRALVRGWLRDHPADAGGCRRRLPLDDRRAVPERRGPRTGDARAGRRNGDGGRLRGSRGRLAPCWRPRSPSPRPSRSSCSAVAASSGCAETTEPAAFSTGRDRPRSARSWAPP